MTLVLDWANIASWNVTVIDPVKGGGESLVCDFGDFYDGFVFSTISIQDFLFGGSPVRHEVVANSGSVFWVGVPLVDEIFDSGKVSKTHVELFKISVGLVFLGEVLHEFVDLNVDSCGSADKCEGKE